MPLTAPPNIASQKIYAEQVRLLYRQGVLIQALGIVTAFLAAAALSPVVPREALALWLVVLTLVTTARLLIAAAFKKKQPKEDEIRRWGDVYIAGTFLAGILWASLAFFFDPAWPAPYQVVLFAIFTGVIAAAFNTNSSIMPAFPAFSLPIIVAALIVTGIQAQPQYLLLSGMFIIYSLLMYASSRTYYSHLRQALAIRFENEALATRLAESNEQLSRLADKDELTGLHNRRSMNRFLHRAWQRCETTGEPLSILFIDIDYFKQYNDTYGHTEGDCCLQAIASVIHTRTCETDGAMAARFGGEEFALILPAQDSRSAFSMAGKLQKDLEDRSVPHAHSMVAPRVTMSIGIATAHPAAQGGAPARLLREADKALYEAKGRGRICTVALQL